MFAAYCEECRERTLVWHAQIDALVNTDRGIVVLYRCPRGHAGAWLTGRAVSAAR